jgi:hypothetical protein
MKKYIALENKLYESFLVIDLDKINDEILPVNRKTGGGADKNQFFIQGRYFDIFKTFFPLVYKDREDQITGRNKATIKNYFNISSLFNDLDFVNKEITDEYSSDGLINKDEFFKELIRLSKAQNLNTTFYIESEIANAQNGIGFKNWDENFKSLIKIILLPTTQLKVYLFKESDDVCAYWEFKQDFIEGISIKPIENNTSDVQNTIYFGSPGTGKSHTADLITNGKAVQKVTFHPDYDYHSFVGGYKPTMDGDKIAYKFVPQIFTKIYIDAWKNLVSTDETQPFYLQIEEINRGNCAEIFGDLFQLLDRDKDGFSKYEVTAEEELYKYLLSADGFGENHDGIKEGKLRFPSNLKIIATMNTSDQSLFPMDSAFKRRWDWIYVPIDLECKSSDFIIQLTNGKSFNWLDFLGRINEEIFEITKSQDKQIGNWFIDAQNSGKVISESTFVNKVVFYLWNDVFKDEENTIFKSAEGKNLTYTSFFENGVSNNLISYILEERLKLTDLNKAEPITTNEE